MSFTCLRLHKGMEIAFLIDFLSCIYHQKWKKIMLLENVRGKKSPGIYLQNVTLLPQFLVTTVVK